MRRGEVREGGFAWNFLKGFAVLWTVLMGVGFFVVWEAVPSIGPEASEFERAAFVIGRGVSVIGWVGVWFVVMAGALMLGLFLKKNSVIERGEVEEDRRVLILARREFRVNAQILGDEDEQGEQDVRSLPGPMKEAMSRAFRQSGRS